MTHTAWLDALSRQLGPQGLWRPGVEADAAQLHAHEVDWRGRYHGRALALARPASVAEVVTVVQACAAQGVAIVPQGGNTSLVGGSVPDGSGQQLVLNLQRLNQVISIDAANLSMVVQSGCLLSQVQAAAQTEGLLFPLSLASEGSCTIGGNLASNAGGTQVLRYGTARALCLGLQVVTPQGQVLDGLSALRKDNTGYDLRDLYIGSEGTLGIITAASLRLHPQPRGVATALLACEDLSQAVALLQMAHHHLDAGLTAFEVMARGPLALVQQHQAPAAAALSPLLDPRGAPPEWVVLIENTSCESDAHAQERLQLLLTQAMTLNLTQGVVVATQTRQRQQMWQLREGIPQAEKCEGLMVKHDIGMPTSEIPRFVTEVGQALQARWPQSQVVCFGHLGDGNLHYNVQPPADARQGLALEDFERAVNTLVFDAVERCQGTLSAEHGIGQLRREELAQRASPVALQMMQAIKKAIDPAGLMNPGRVLR